MNSSCHLASLWLRQSPHNPPNELRESTCGIIAALISRLFHTQYNLYAMKHVSAFEVLLKKNDAAERLYRALGRPRHTGATVDFANLVRVKRALRYRRSMGKKNVEIIFRDTHDTQEWTCGYCKRVATTIRQGIAVCPLHKYLWTVGVQPPSVPTEALTNH